MIAQTAQKSEEQDNACSFQSISCVLAHIATSLRCNEEVLGSDVLAVIKLVNVI